VGGLINVINDDLNFSPLLKGLRNISTRIEEWLYWRLDGHLQIVEMCYRLLCAQDSSKMRPQDNSSEYSGQQATCLHKNSFEQSQNLQLRRKIERSALDYNVKDLLSIKGIYDFGQIIQSFCTLVFIAKL